MCEKCVNLECVNLSEAVEMCVSGLETESTMVSGSEVTGQTCWSMVVCVKT